MQSNTVIQKHYLMHHVSSSYSYDDLSLLHPSRTCNNDKPSLAWSAHSCTPSTSWGLSPAHEAAIDSLCQSAQSAIAKLCCMSPPRSLNLCHMSPSSWISSLAFQGFGERPWHESIWCMPGSRASRRYKSIHIITLLLTSEKIVDWLRSGGRQSLK
jgi:hypothetical protein